MVYITVAFIFLSSLFAHVFYEKKALQNSTQLLEFQLTILEKFRRQKKKCFVYMITISHFGTWGDHLLDNLLTLQT